MSNKRSLSQKILFAVARLAVKIAYTIAQAFGAFVMGPGGNVAQKIYERELEVLKKLE